MTADTDRWDRNLGGLGRVAPHLVDSVRRLSPKSHLTEAEDGDWDIVDNGRSRFGGSVTRHFAELMEKFNGAPLRIASPEPEAGAADLFTNRLHDRLGRRAGDAGILLSREHQLKRAFFLVVFGFGLGGHIKDLIAATECRHVIVVEPDLDCLHHSLAVFDWPGFAAGLETEGRRVDFIVDPDPAGMAQQLSLTMRAANPAGLDGATIFMNASDDVLQDAFSRFLATEAVKVPHALGCYNDERIMLRNSLYNLRQPAIRLFDRTRARAATPPVFVIGAGPSLDDTMAVLKENRERAIVVTCGSALRAVMAGGISPDFHVEVENIGVEPILSHAAELGDLGPICLVAPTTVEPVATTYFKNVVCYFKLGSTPDTALNRSSDNALALTEPGVANAAVSFALSLGAPEIYFFGLDLGVRGEGRHHAENTYHFDDAAFIDERDYVYSMPTEANFGGPFLTSPFLELTRTAITLAIRHFGAGSKVFNCSDGALIPGAEPMRPGDIALAADAPVNREVVGRLVEAMPRLNRNQMDRLADLGPLRDSITEVIDRCRTAIADGPSLLDKDFLDPMMETLHVAQYVHPPAERTEHLAAALTVRGTVLNYLLVTEFLLNRVLTDEAAAQTEAIVREELETALVELRDATSKDVPDLAGWFPGRDAQPGAAAGYGDGEMIPEASLTWSNVGRNASCPCGSGKRYKHCHGRSPST